MPTEDGPEAKQRGVAASAILTALTRREPRFDLLGGAPKLADADPVAQNILSSSWNVHARADLLGALDFLATRGHTAEYQKVAAAFEQAPPDARHAPPLRFVAEHGHAIGARGLLAWDLGRLVAVAGWGFLAGYCSEEEAWGAVLSAGTRLRAAYGSWEEYGAQYRLGALFCDEAATAALDPVLSQLLSFPTSPWKLVPWRLDGGASPGGSASAGGAPPPAYGAGFPAPTNPGPTPGAAAAPPSPPPYVPPGAPGAPTSYGGVPVVAPTPGSGSPLGPGRKSLVLLAIAVVAGLVVLGLLVALALHFRHHPAPHGSPAREPPAHEGRRGRH